MGSIRIQASNIKVFFFGGLFYNELFYSKIQKI
jgi:hypothetical protein